MSYSEIFEDVQSEGLVLTEREIEAFPRHINDYLTLARANSVTTINRIEPAEADTGIAVSKVDRVIGKQAFVQLFDLVEYIFRREDEFNKLIPASVRLKNVLAGSSHEDTDSGVEITITRPNMTYIAYAEAINHLVGCWRTSLLMTKHIPEDRALEFAKDIKLCLVYLHQVVGYTYEQPQDDLDSSLMVSFSTKSLGDMILGTQNYIKSLMSNHSLMSNSASTSPDNLADRLDARLRTKRLSVKQMLLKLIAKMMNEPINFETKSEQ